MIGETNSDCILWLISDAFMYVTWLIYRSHRRRGYGKNFLTAFTYGSQSNSKMYLQKYNCVTQTNLPIESALTVRRIRKYGLPCLRTFEQGHCYDYFQFGPRCYMVQTHLCSLTFLTQLIFGNLFPALPTLCAGNYPVTGEFPSQRPVTRSFHAFYLRLSE